MANGGNAADKYDFNQQLAIGEEHESELDLFFSQFFTIIPVPLQIQKLGVDRIFERKRIPQRRASVEYKTDIKAGETGNAYIETLSNSNTGKAGWAYTSIAQELVYYIPQFKRVGVISMLDIKKNLYEWRSMYREVRCENKDYYGMGVLVPLGVLADLMYRKFTI